jgi:glycosyltransferase involved in cell wall biosynthesis
LAKDHGPSLTRSGLTDLRTSENPELVFVVPGRLDQLTGGYLYDRHILDGLRARGRSVKLIEFAPGSDGDTFADLPDGSITVVDGLALPGLERVIAAQARRLRLVALIHHPLAEETGLTQAQTEQLAALEAAMLPRFRGVLCPSRQTAAAVASYSVSPDRIAVVPPGTAKPNRRGGRPRRAARALLCVASLIPRKGHSVLVEALRRVRHLDWRLVCVGSLQRHPPTVRLVRRMISAAGLGRRITLAGEWSPERVRQAYRAADIFVLPSFHEGYGMAYAEAMAYGLPIIASSAGAIPETVPPAAGLLVPPGDAAALTEALRRILAEPGLAARLAAGSRAAGARLPGWPQATEQWEKNVDRIASLATPL